MQSIINLWLAVNDKTKLGTWGPFLAAVGVLLVNTGYALQGKFEEVDKDAVLLAIGLLGTRAKLYSSQDVGIR